MWFQSKRTKAINACLDGIVRDVSQWLLPPTVRDVAVMLRRDLAAQGIALSLDDALKVVQRRLRHS